MSTSFKKKVLVAVTARPSYSRIRSALNALRDERKVEVQCLCSGAALSEPHGRVIDRIRADGFEIAGEGETLVPGGEPVRMAETAAHTILFTARHLQAARPDWVVTIADRYETMGTAVAASYLGIPLIHVQGGEITGNIDERVRHAVTKLSDIHLVANDQAAQRLIAMGEHPDTIHVTGCPSIDLARESMQMTLEDLRAALVPQNLGDLDLERGFVVVLQHADTTEHASSYEQMRMTLRAVTASGLPFVVFHPNSDAGSDDVRRALNDFRRDSPGAPMWSVNNLEGKAFLRLLQQSRCLVGNSSVGIRECAYLGVPVVNLGDRQYGRERGCNVLDCGWNLEDMMQAVSHQLRQTCACSHIYGTGHSGERMAEIIANLAVPRTKRYFEGVVDF
ncbi:MAG: UDP-N-acetylglucosamine 2-epimerase (hydrolyzing) [Burkholderiales bacterium]|nr:UDP-N-acetylglucosamine 2-epimerase (hydrolyzing) [Burkholderiales bacterium]